MNARHILLPTDRSVTSLRPIERAPELFEGRRVTLLSVVVPHNAPAVGSPFAPPVEMPGFHEQLDAARDELAAMAAAIPNATEVHVEVLTDTSPAKAVARWAQENEVDVIALSTHGRTGLRRFALGSVAEAILRHASVPVLVFPPSHGEGEDAS